MIPYKWASMKHNVSLRAIAVEYAAKQWAMDPTALQAFFETLNTLEPLAVADMDDLDQVQPEPFLRDGTTAIIPITGPMLCRVPEIFRWFGIQATDMTEVAALVQTLDADDSIETIAFHIDSGGGEVCIALDDLAEAIKNSSKTTESRIGDMCASAALWVGSQSSTISAHRMSDIGSIGVYTVIMDRSGMAKQLGIDVMVINNEGATVKGGGTPGAVVTAEYLAEVQRMINGANDRFVSALVEGLGKTEAEVRKLNTGQMWMGQDALALGLVTEIYSPAGAVSAGLTTSDSFQANEGEAMSLDVAELIAENPSHSKSIMVDAKADVGLDEIKANLATAIEAEAKKELFAKVEAAEVAKTEAESKLEEANAKIKALETDISVLADKVDTAESLLVTEDPGPNMGADNTNPQITAAELAKMSGREKASFFADGGQVIGEDI